MRWANQCIPLHVSRLRLMISGCCRPLFMMKRFILFDKYLQLSDRCYSSFEHNSWSQIRGDLFPVGNSQSLRLKPNHLSILADPIDFPPHWANLGKFPALALKIPTITPLPVYSHPRQLFHRRRMVFGFLLKGHRASGELLAQPSHIPCSECFHLNHPGQDLCRNFRNILLPQHPQQW